MLTRGAAKCDHHKFKPELKICNVDGRTPSEYHMMDEKRNRVEPQSIVPATIVFPHLPFAIFGPKWSYMWKRRGPWKHVKSQKVIFSIEAKFRQEAKDNARLFC
jgi:hypothetical protein